MAIIVDKEQKKRDIALACKELFVNRSINDLTISEVAKTAGVGKGTIYEYFKNKEEIVFEISNVLMQEYNLRKEKKIQEASSTKEKIQVFFHIFHVEREKDLRKIYKEFVSISLASSNEEMIKFQTNCSNRYFEWFESIIQDGIDKGELIPNSIKLARGLFVMGEGVFVANMTTNSITDVKKELDTFFDTLFELIEVKQ